MHHRLHGHAPKRCSMRDIRAPNPRRKRPAEGSRLFLTCHFAQRSCRPRGSAVKPSGCYWCFWRRRRHGSWAAIPRFWGRRVRVCDQWSQAAPVEGAGGRESWICQACCASRGRWDWRWRGSSSAPPSLFRFARHGEAWQRGGQRSRWPCAQESRTGCESRRAACQAEAGQSRNSNQIKSM